MTEHQLRHLSPSVGLLWQPPLSSAMIRCPRDLIRHDKGNNKRLKVVAAAGTPCLAQAGWRHSARAVCQAVKRNISIYLPTNYRISFKHHLARTCSLSGLHRALAEIGFLFPLLITPRTSGEHLVTSLGISLSAVGLAFSRCSLLPQKYTHLSASCFHSKVPTSCFSLHPARSRGVR